MANVKVFFFFFIDDNPPFLCQHSNYGGMRPRQAARWIHGNSLGTVTSQGGSVPTLPQNALVGMV